MQAKLCSSKRGTPITSSYCSPTDDLPCCVDDYNVELAGSQLGIDVSTTITTSAGSCFITSGMFILFIACMYVCLLCIFLYACK